MTPELNFLYNHSTHIGYGYQGTEQARALRSLGVDVYDGLPGTGDLDFADKANKVCNTAVFLTTPTHAPGWWKGQNTVLYTMWETMYLPQRLGEAVSQFDRLLVPSMHNQELFSEFHDDVHYVPLGVDTERWKYRERSEPGRFFTFLSAGSGTRKGLDLVRKAFLEVFGDRPDGSGPIPRLVLKNPRGEDFSAPNVEVISGFLSPEEEVDLYAGAHCYVQPARGEGWGMQPLQAMAQGCPTILTNAHGHTAFAHFGIPISARSAASDYFIFGESGDWWEPDYNELCDAMWHVYDNYTLEAEKAAGASQFISRHFTWENSARDLLDVIGMDALNTQPPPMEEWRTLDTDRVDMTMSRDWRGDICGVTRLFKAGETYHEPVDVKTLLELCGAVEGNNGDS